MTERFQNPRLNITQLAPENNESLTRPAKAEKASVTSLRIALGEVELAQQLTEELL